MRIEETAALCDHVEASIRRIIPASEVADISDNIGLPYSTINLTYTSSAPIGSSDADIYVSLSEQHRPTAEYLHEIRQALEPQYPGVVFSRSEERRVGKECRCRRASCSSKQRSDVSTRQAYMM